MGKAYGNGDSAIGDYVYQLLQPEDERLKAVCASTVEAGMPEIQVSPLDGRHLEVLTLMVGAKKAVEIGTLAGYSGVCLLKAMGAGGHLYTFESSPQHAQVAHRNFKVAGFEGQVSLYVGEALQRLKQIEFEGPFDLVFIDADKGGYPDYLAWAEKHLRVGGVVIGDNTFAFGRITQTLTSEEAFSVKALQDFNSSLASSKSFCTTIFPTGEGLTVGVKVKNI